MKAKLILSAMLFFGIAISLSGQRGHHRADGGGYYAGNHYGNNHSSYRYNSRRNYNNNSYNYYADRMDKYDRKRFRKLIRKLRERERCALDDGYISRRERRHINEVRSEIDLMISRYERRDRNRYYSGYRPGCR